METRFFVVAGTYFKEIGYRRNVFGPYSDEDKARRIADIAEGEVIELPVTTLEEAIEILEEEQRRLG